MLIWYIFIVDKKKLFSFNKCGNRDLKKAKTFPKMFFQCTIFIGWLRKKNFNKENNTL